MRNTPKHKKQTKQVVSRPYPFNRDLPKEEYDFSTIPEEEWSLAAEWEHERELGRYINRKMPEGGISPEREPFDTPEMLPWLQIASIYRRWWLRDGIQYPILEPTKEQIASKNLAPPNAFNPIVVDMVNITDEQRELLDSKVAYHRFRRKKYGPRWYDSKIFVAEINPVKSRTEIKKEFSDFIDQFVPVKDPGVDKKKGTGLMDLSIYRIISAGYTRQECIEMSQWMTNGKIPEDCFRAMGHDNVATANITKALQRMEKELDRLFQSQVINT